MPQKKKLKIIKIPLGYKPSYKPIQFPPFPQLYLDLLENKDKVKSDLRNVYYEPKGDLTDGTPVHIDNTALSKAGNEIRQEVEVFDKDHQFINDLQFNNDPTLLMQAKSMMPTMPTMPSIPASSPSGQMQTQSSSHENDHEQEDNMFDFDTPSRLDSILSSNNEPRDERVRHTEDRKDKRLSDTYDTRERDRGYDRRDNERERDRGYDRRENERERDRGYDRRENDRERDRGYERDDEDEVDRHFDVDENVDEDDDLGFLLSKPSKPESKSVYIPKQKASSSSVSSSSSSAYQSQSQSNSQSNAAPQQPTFQQSAQQPQPSQPVPPPSSNAGYPPSLQSIAAGEGMKQGVLNMQMRSMSEAEEAQQKRELLLKFKTLKKYYKDATIPEYTEYANLDIMKADYSMLVKQLHLDSRIENYKRVLMVGFGVIEFLIQRVLKFEEISGFTAQQMLSMNDYERILLEIGEKHKVEPGEGLGPELKLIGLVFFNAAVFVGMKMLMKGGGNPILDSIGGLAPQSSPAPRAQQSFASGASGASGTSGTSGASGSQAAGVQPNGGGGAVGQVSTGQPVQPQQKRKMKGPEISLDDF